MRSRRTVLFLAALAITVGARGAAAEEESRFSIRADFCASSYPSDESLKTEFYPALGSDPPSCGADGQMTYHFDRKFGLSGRGALCWRAHPRIEIELWAGYTDMQLEITQHSAVRLMGGCWSRPGIGRLHDYDTRKDADVSYASIRPAVNLTLSRKSRVVPYLSVGLDVMRISASADVDFLLLALRNEGSTYYTIDTTGAVRLEGSDWTFGLDIGSGLEIRVASSFSLTVGFAYLFQFGKAFPEFEELVTADSDPAARSVRYYNDGMTLKNISAMIGFKMYL